MAAFCPPPPLDLPAIITALATVVIAGFTIILACVTSRQARLASDAIALARYEFDATHRPRLRVRLIQSDGFADDKMLPTGIMVANVGETEAINVRFDARFLSKTPMSTTPPALEGMTPEPGHGPATLAPGDRKCFEPPLRLLQPYEAPEIRAKQRTLTLVGRLRYQDRRGVERETGFSWPFDVATGEFRKPRREDEHNYED